MHVLVTADTVGGVWTYTSELVTGLVRHGVGVTLVSFGSIPEPWQTAWMEGLRNLDYRPTAFRLEWMQESAGDIRASSEYLLTVIREKRPDLLHLNQFCYGALESDVPKIVMAHSDVLSWWDSVHGDVPPNAGWIRWYRKTVQQGLEGSTLTSRKKSLKQLGVRQVIATGCQRHSAKMTNDRLHSTDLPFPLILPGEALAR